MRILLSNGIWYYKKIRKNYDLEKVQARDRHKEKVILNNGYQYHIVKDMGGYDKKFVEEQFQIFLFSLIYMDD